MKVSTTLLAFAAIVALQLASAHPLAKRSCACNLKGSDVCASCIPSAIPRPVRPRAPVQGVQRVIYQKFAPVEFKPQDVCTCQSGLVTAPEIPRVPCKLHSVSYKGQYAVDQPFPIGGDDCGDISVNPCEDNVAQASPVRTYVIPAEQPNEEIVEEIHAPAAPAPVAADAVSLALAYDMATRSQKNILEENLAFGHMQTPKDGRIITKKRIVPESGLYAVRNQIVELKAPSGFGRSCDDEAEASLLAAQQASCVEEETSYSGSLPSYRDLGFAPVTGDCKLVPGQYNPTPNVVQTVEYTVPAPKSRPTAVYTPCDALAGIERGRGSSGTDYYARSEAQETPEVVAVSSDSDSYARDESYGPSRSVSYEREESYGPSRSGSYEREESYVPSRSNSYEREESYSPRHSGRPGCSCGCGY